MAKKQKGVKENHRYLIGQVKSVGAPNFIMNPVELYEYLPQGKEFSIKRVYWIADVKGEKKSGQHVHTDEDEIFIVMRGSCNIILDDTGKKRSIPLKQNDIVWVPRLVWHGYEKTSTDCIVLALTNINYDPERKGYIIDYAEFKKIVAQK